MELLYADDLALYGESLDDMSRKYKRWRKVLKGEGLRVKRQKNNYCMVRK